MELACMMPDVACDAVLNLILLAIRTSEDSDDELLCCSLVNILLSKQKFLLGENEERRWTLHAILRATLQLASRPNQLLLINYLYKHTWPYAHEMGNRAAQLVDLLSYYLPRFLSKLVGPNSSYMTLKATFYATVMRFSGSPDISVLSKSPCLICSDSDHPMEQLKLSAIKLDSRFTTSAQMIKLMGHFEVARIIIRLSEIKRTKMVKRFRFYYCNKILESAIDLKNRPELWEKAADVKVNKGDTEIDVQLPIPVVTYAPEFVHCPRCSTSVTPNPGICSNCGENVFQCVKCRAINYDEKEPFLCNSCGFCKYARLEAVLVGRSLPSVQAIEDDNDRKTVRYSKTAFRNIFSDRCAGCMSALIVHCVSLIQATCSDTNAMEEIIREDFVFNRLVSFRFTYAICMLLMRIALKRPILVLKEATRRIGAHPQELRIQAYLLSIINDIIYPLLKKEEDFLIQIEKDALQEDYLQGRMLGNPYKSSDAGMGPLMRDIKNKICRDCELVALLDDDTGMELLVNQQIVALDLSVNDVYEKLWRSDHHGQAMVIVYRMRGLLGDATEPFIKTLANTNGGGIKEKSIEETIALQYLELSRILLVDVLATDRIEKVCFLLLFFFGYSNIYTKLQSIGGASFEQTSWLLELSMGSDEELSASLLEAVTSIAPNLCLGNSDKVLMKLSNISNKASVIDNDRKIRDRVVQKVEILCKITSAIHDSASGRTLKKKMMDAGLITDACRYLAENHPPIFNVSVMGPEWKYFLSKPSLKYVLKLMAGMARSHKPSQEAIAENSLPILHRLEQISSAEHIGTLAENVMEELKKNDQVAVQIEKVRQETKIKKRQLAMAMRQKQLSKMGMEIGKKGQVKVGYSVRLNLKENKVINGRNYSFTTVSMAGSRSEWASAALHNANTKCNVIMPIWSKQVKDSDMEHSFQRLSTDLEVAVDCDTINLDSLTLDIAELLDRFVKFRSFSALSHGGGRESNMQYMAILILLVQYLKKISISLVMDTAEQWNDKRLDLLKSLQGSKKSWKDARHELLVWVAVDYYHNKILQCRTGDRTQHMRENIIKILENCSKFVSYFDSELSQCRSYGELMKAVGKLT
uniref:Bm2761, isoform b n=1 Tax=Brugia malayi TaxID=6279 RepID=A0A1I9G5X6_BRUMA|nr:Bm2761, isoform b [Brugia malayi]